MAGTYKNGGCSVTVTGTDGTKNVDLINTTGISEVSAKIVKLYPNPTSGTLNTKLPANNGTEGTIRVTNILGSVILNNKVVNSSTAINLDLSGYDNGVYFVKVIGNGFQNTVKVVKN